MIGKNTTMIGSAMASLIVREGKGLEVHLPASLSLARVERYFSLNRSCPEITVSDVLRQERTVDKPRGALLP